MPQRRDRHENYSSCRTKAGFKSVQIFKDQPLGYGSFGVVYKARCDDFICAAKMIHPILYDPAAEQLMQSQCVPIRRFEQECALLSTLRHPNIVQFIGIHRDLDTGLPVLLMECMDESLTCYLESFSLPIPYHVQVNICHSVASALSYLHANNIVHRDVDSNDILLTS